MMCPGCPPPLQNTSTYKQADFQHSVNKNQKYSSYFSELSEILQSPKHTTVVRENPQGLYMHTHFVALHKKSTNTHIRQTKIKNPQTPQKLHSFNRPVGTGNSGLRKVSEYASRKKGLGSPRRFFLLFVLKCRSLQMCVGASSLSLAQ